MLPAFGKYRILKFHDSTQDPFSPLSTECLQIPLTLCTKIEENQLSSSQNIYMFLKIVCFTSHFSALHHFKNKLEPTKDNLLIN